MPCEKPKCPRPAAEDSRLCHEHIDEARQKAREKILSTTDKPNGDQGCWLWSGATQQTGYGYMSSYGLSNNSKPAHWMSLFAFGNQQFNVLSHGEVHHTCGTQNCVNPNHLIHMQVEFHELLHQLSNPVVASVVCDHLLEAYPDAAQQIAALRSAIA